MWQVANQLPSKIKLGVPENHPLRRKCIADYVAESLEAGRRTAGARHLYPLEHPPGRSRRSVRGNGERVCLLTCGLQMGGAERQTVSLACHLNEMGYSVTVGNVGACSGNPFIDTGIEYTESVSRDDLTAARAVIWWGNSLARVEGSGGLPGSIYVAHSCSEIIAGSMAKHCKLIAHVAAVSSPALQLAREVLGPIPGRVIWNGTEPGDSLARKRQRSDPFVIGYLGRYATEKNLFTALEALQILPPNVRFRLYGDGPLRVALSEMAAEIHVQKRVDVCGTVGDPGLALRDFDCLLLPSTFEGFPMTAIEAAHAGIPVICTPHGDLPLVFREGERGLMVRPEPRSIAAAVQRLVDWPDLGPWLGANARAFAREHLTARRMAEGYAAMIKGMP